MHIVLVDPSRLSLKLIGQTLNGAGHTVIPFGDGAAALAHLRSGAAIDVLMTSFELPLVSGLELCWEARLLANAGQTLHVIAMSSNADSHHLATALDAGADDFVVKPLVPVELFARLRAAGRLNQARRELIRLATVDPLTGLLNRRAFFERLQSACLGASETHPVALAVCDIDHFKSVNDNHGHDVGDRVLQAVAARLQLGARDAARLGGEEFALLLPGLDIEAAWAKTERLRHAIAGIAVPLSDGRTLSVTLSLGLAAYRPGETVDQFIKAADVALYAAKTSGRNRGMIAHAVRSEARSAAPQIATTPEPA